MSFLPTLCSIGTMTCETLQYNIYETSLSYMNNIAKFIGLSGLDGGK